MTTKEKSPSLPESAPAQGGRVDGWLPKVQKRAWIWAEVPALGRFGWVVGVSRREGAFNLKVEDSYGTVVAVHVGDPILPIILDLIKKYIRP
jgi:hypothetical protein